MDELTRERYGPPPRRLNRATSVDCPDCGGRVRLTVGGTLFVHWEQRIGRDGRKYEATKRCSGSGARSP